MALISGSDSLSNAFTPLVGDFTVHASGGRAVLQSRAQSGDPWSDLGFVDGRANVPNPTAGAQYRFIKPAFAYDTPNVRADQDVPPV